MNRHWKFADAELTVMPGGMLYWARGAYRQRQSYAQYRLQGAPGGILAPRRVLEELGWLMGDLSLPEADLPEIWPMLRDNPDHDEALLVFADLLMEQGNARGHFVRAQIDRARNPYEAHYRERETELYDTYGFRWLAPLLSLWPRQRVALEAEFRRGFVARLQLPMGRFVEAADRLLDVVPLLHEVWLTEGTPVLAGRVGEQPLLEQLHWLRMGRIGSAGAAAFARSPYLASVRALELGRCQLDVDGVVALLAAESFRPKKLSLNNNPLGLATLDHLLAWPGLATLEFLDLTSIGLPKGSGARLAANAERFAALKHLVTPQPEWTWDDDAEPIVDAKWPKLERLEIGAWRWVEALEGVDRAAHRGIDVD